MRHQALGRMVASVLVVVAGLAGTALRAQTKTDTAWTTTWPSLGEATSLILDPANPLRLFAGTPGGVANSEDGGHSWNLLAGSPAGAEALALDPSDGSRLFAGSEFGIFRSTDGGAQFSLMEAHLTSAVAIDPSHPQTIYAAGFGSEVHKSADGGSTWQTTPTAIPLTRAIASLIVDPENGKNVFAGIGSWVYSYYYYSNIAALIGSSDAGQTWRVFLDNSHGADTVNALAFDPRSSQIIYAAKGPFVYRSRNGGASWTPGTFRLGSLVKSLVVDSLNPDTVYAGTDHGVFRSVDAGAHWASLPAPPSLDVRALALDAAGQVLHAATAVGVYEADVTADAPSFPCQNGADTLCLLGSRFRVRAQAWDPRTSSFTIAWPVPQSDGFGYFSLPNFTRSRSLPEILVKMVEADVPPWNSDWVFFGGLTDVWYLVTVTDTMTGKVRSYENDPNAPYCGGADTSGFPVAAAMAGAPLDAIPALRADGDALALLSGRFQLTLSATDPRAERSISGRAVPRDDQFGYFSLPELTGDPALPEVVVKMIDARPLGGGFWLFQSGMTSVPYTLHVLDTVTGASRSYESTGAFCSSADTAIPDAP